MRDGLVDLVDGGAEFLARDAVVAAKALLEGVHVLLKVQDIELLIFHDLQLAAVLQRVERRVAQQRDDGNEKLRPHDVHLLVPVRHIHDAVVVQLVVDLQQRHQHRVLAVLFAAVLVQLLEMEINSVPLSSDSRKMKSPLLPVRASLSFSKYAVGKAVMRSVLNCVRQCCSRLSPIIFVDWRALKSL